MYSSNSFSGGVHYKLHPYTKFFPLPYEDYRAANQFLFGPTKSHFPLLKQRELFHVSNSLVVILPNQWNWQMKKKIFEKRILFSQGAFRFLVR